MLRYRIAMDTTATVEPSRLARFARSLRGTLRLGLNVALPPLCPACRGLVNDSGLCAECWQARLHRAALLSAPRHSVRL